MTVVQPYARLSNARNAAVAQLGKNAVEGTHYEVKRLEDGRFTYRLLQPEKGPTGAEQGKGKERRFETSGLHFMLLESGVGEPTNH